MDSSVIQSDAASCILPRVMATVAELPAPATKLLELQVRSIAGQAHQILGDLDRLLGALIAFGHDCLDSGVGGSVEVFYPTSTASAKQSQG